MSKVNFSEMSLDEIQTLIAATNEEYHSRYYERQEEVQTIQDNIATTILDLETLLGPPTTKSGTGNIREVQNYSGADMAKHATISLPLAFQGLETLAETVLKLAKIVQSKNDQAV